MLLTSLMKNQK